MRWFLRQMRHPWPWWLLLAAWVGVLYMLSEQSSLPAGPDVPFKDKIEHAGYFTIGGLFLLMLLGASGLRWGHARTVAIGFLFGAVIGALDEFHQTFTPGRSGNDVFDWMADTAGGGIGAFIALHVLSRLLKDSGST